MLRWADFLLAAFGSGGCWDLCVDGWGCVCFRGVQELGRVDVWVAAFSMWECGDRCVVV